jgi:pyruvate dehydrogenase (quinone)
VTAVWRCSSALLTVRTHRLRVKVVVFNNSSLGMVRLEQMVAGVPFFETDHDQVDFAAIAAAAGFHTVRVEDPRELRAGYRSVLDHNGPALLDVVTARTRSRCRPHHRQGAQGFALATSKIVLSGVWETWST